MAADAYLRQDNIGKHFAAATKTLMQIKALVRQLPVLVSMPNQAALQ